MMHGERGSTTSSLNASQSTVLPVGLALLRERLRSLLGVLGCEHHLRELLLDLVALLHGDGEAAEDALFGGADGEEPVGEDAPGPPEGPVDQLVGLDDLVEEP